MKISNSALDVLTLKVMEHYKNPLYSQHFQAIIDQVHVGNVDSVSIAEVLKTVPYTKEQAYAANLYRLSVPSVTTARWEDKDWINYISICNGWTVEVADE